MGKIHTSQPWKRVPHSHGASMNGTRTGAYRSWCAMRQRCNSADPYVQAAYADRNIKICARWEKFENFLFDMGERPGDLGEYSLERIHNNKGYCKSNCRWALRGEQTANTRRTKMTKVLAKKLFDRLLTPKEAVLLHDVPLQCAQNARYGRTWQGVNRG